jgi:hypothetical protein
VYRRSTRTDTDGTDADETDTSDTREATPIDHRVAVEGRSAGDRPVIGPLAVGFEGLLPFLVPVFLFVCGLIGYGVLVYVNRWLNGS